MHLSTLLITFALVCAVHSVKFTTDINACMAQVEGILGGESEARVKTAIETIIANTKTGDVKAIQKVVKDASDAEKATVLDKYMGASCSQLKSCFVCPLEMA